MSVEIFLYDFKHAFVVLQSQMLLGFIETFLKENQLEIFISLYEPSKEVLRTNSHIKAIDKT